ncbi:MAG: hypothetical protein FIB04_01490, partial [Gammaproteobacteria bacterium]|nr:hypothetical protein [Gammaproteobacteria bacterium]
MTGHPIPETHPFIERLLHAEAYPHAVVLPVRVVETHISWVLLTGACAYKIKKPVKLSFLDYSTLARRHLFCQEELRLNRRYAPDLYLGVSTICGPAASPGIDRDGEVLEYAVRMRQFDPHDELNALLLARSVAVEELSALGAAIATFHADATPVDPATTFGTAATVRRVLLDNFTELRRLPEAAGWHDRVSELERWVDAGQAAAGALIQSRREAGFVRECHGDLHCGNVVRWSGNLTPFDGIEF